MASHVTMPQFTDTMVSGIVSYWIKSEGDSISLDEPIAVIETDKATMEILSPQDGYLLKILAQEGESIDVGEPIAIIGEPGENIDSMLGEAAESPAKPEQMDETGGSTASRVTKIASPAAKRLASENNIDLDEIEGSGKDGLISAKDVKDYIKKRSESSPVIERQEKEAKEHFPGGHVEDEIISIKGIRAAMFESMTASAKIPQVTTVAQADMTEIALFSKETSVSITSFVVSAVVEALKKFPLINSRIEGDSIRLFKKMNIGVAVSTPNGLVVPVIKDAENKHVIRISKEISDLARKGREGRLSLDDLKERTFTVTNSGVFGSIFFTPRINPPEVAVLGIGKIVEQPVVLNGGIHIRAMMYLCLSYDHRVIDGETAVKFVQEIRMMLESPKEHQIA